MKKLSKIVVLFFALAITFSLVGCGEEPSNPGVYDGGTVGGARTLTTLSDLSLPTGVLTATVLKAANLELSGNPTLTVTGGAIVITDRVNDWDTVTIKKEFFDGFIEDGDSPPYEVTFRGTVQAAISGEKTILKIAGSGNGAGDASGANAKKTFEDGTFEVVGTVSAANLTATQYTPGIRLQTESATGNNDGANSRTATITITDIIVKK